MDASKIGIKAQKKCMNLTFSYTLSLFLLFFALTGYFLTLFRKTEAISTLYTISISRSFPVKIELFLKYTDDTPTTPTYNDDTPDGTDKFDRGFLLTEFTTVCEMYTIGSKSRKFDNKVILMRLLL